MKTEKQVYHAIRHIDNGFNPRAEQVVAFQGTQRTAMNYSHIIGKSVKNDNTP
jgi:hypothetical protein